MIKTAPPKVQTAFKNLLSYVKQFRTAIQNASSVTSLLASFATLGKNPSWRRDGTTIANWYTSVCGGTLITPDDGDRPVGPPRRHRCPRHHHRCTCRGRRRPGRSTRCRWPGPGCSTCATAPSSRSRAWTRRSCAGVPAPTANSLGVLVVHLGYTERLWLRAICAGEQMDMAWRAHMFELPGRLGSRGGRGLLPGGERAGRRSSWTRSPRSTSLPGAPCGPRPSAGLCST